MEINDIENRIIENPKTIRFIPYSFFKKNYKEAILDFLNKNNLKGIIDDSSNSVEIFNCNSYKLNNFRNEIENYIILKYRSENPKLDSNDIIYDLTFITSFFQNNNNIVVGIL